jgi:hypothetical protein
MEITDNPYRRRWISLSITEYNLPYILRRRCNLKNTKEVFLNVDVFFCIYDRTVSIYLVKVWIYATWRCTYRGADKSLARPGRKQATATKFLQATQKQFRKLSVWPGLRGSNDLRVGRKMATSQLFFFQSGRGKDLSAPLYKKLLEMLSVVRGKYLIITSCL